MAKRFYDETDLIFPHDDTQICFETPKNRINRAWGTTPSRIRFSIALFSNLSKSYRSIWPVEKPSSGHDPLMSSAIAISFKTGDNISIWRVKEKSQDANAKHIHEIGSDCIIAFDLWCRVNNVTIWSIRHLRCVLDEIL